MKNCLSQVLEQSRTRTQVLEQPRTGSHSAMTYLYKNIQECSVYYIIT